MTPEHLRKYGDTMAYMVSLLGSPTATWCIPTCRITPGSSGMPTKTGQTAAMSIAADAGVS